MFYQILIRYCQNGPETISENRDPQEIKDNYKPLRNPDYEIRIEGNNLLDITVKCFKAVGVDEFILSSSLNPDVYFTSKKDGIFDKVFRSGKYFTTRAAKKTQKV